MSRKPDLNRRPTHYECVALPTELFRQHLILECGRKYSKSIRHLKEVWLKNHLNLHLNLLTEDHPSADFHHRGREVPQ